MPQLLDDNLLLLLLLQQMCSGEKGSSRSNGPTEPVNEPLGPVDEPHAGFYTPLGEEELMVQ